MTLASSPYSLAPWTTSGPDIYRASGNVGIGTSTPDNLYSLTVQGDGTEAPTAGTVYRAGGNTGVSLSYTSPTDLANFEVWNATSTGYLRFGTNNAERMRIDQLGNVGIGRNAAANRLEVEGNASKTIVGGWSANSDARIKRDVSTISGALEKLDRVRLVNFHYTDEYRKAHPSVKSRQYCNVIAQEFQQIFPEDVKGSGEKLPNGQEILQVDTYPLTIYSAAAIQELHKLLRTKDDEIAQLRQELATQREFASRVETRFSALEKAIARATDKSTTAYSADNGK